MQPGIRERYPRAELQFAASVPARRGGSDSGAFVAEVVEPALAHGSLDEALAPALR